MSDQKRTTIKLEQPLLMGGTVIHEVVLRDPTYAEYMSLGDPWTYRFTEEGRAVPLDHEPTMALYVQRCLVEPKSHLMIEHCTVRDAMAIKGWLLSFFAVVAPAKGGSTTPSQTSSTTTAE